jgi:hypothetical protein
MYTMLYIHYIIGVKRENLYIHAHARARARIHMHILIYKIMIFFNRINFIQSFLCRYQ